MHITNSPLALATEFNEKKKLMGTKNKEAKNNDAELNEFGTLKLKVRVKKKTMQSKLFDLCAESGNFVNFLFVLKLTRNEDNPGRIYSWNFYVAPGEFMGHPHDNERLDDRGTPGPPLVPVASGPDLLEHRKL